ncbi:protein kinase [Kitasatospora sp. NPDC048239]|uniref:serine/threonine-protein kinase n=1 Tax=Kitasatospora sp. NPDC048239 TaxID=3364046 RepID=UPI0037102378
MSGRGSVLGGRYTLTERIGGGGMGAVWRADDSVLARQVAVKILHPGLSGDGTFARRFRREAQLLAALKHPGIVDVHDYGESEDDSEEQVAYIVMELVEGRPLNTVLTEDGPMPAERALGLLATALDALHAAHRQDIVHRDLKPSNLMLRADGRVTVTDFGIARALASSRLTASHAVIGTALYMAPEQAEGKATTPASDLYSIGVVCYELLTGETPFTGESVLEVALKHLREPAPGLPEPHPQAVRDFVATALAKSPEERFADAAQMAAAARAAIGEGPVVGPRPAAPPAAAQVAPAAAPVAAEAGKAATPAPVPAVAQTVPGRRRRRILIPVIVPVIFTVGAGTAVLIEKAPFRSEAKAVDPQPAPSATMTAGAGTPQPATPSAAGTSATAAATPTPTAAPTAPPGGTLPPTTQPSTPGAAAGTGNQPVKPSPNPGGGAAGGGAATQAPPTTPTPPATNPAQPAATQAPAPQPQTPAVPQGCGGTNWGYIVNVGDGQKLGLANNNLSGGNAAVMGGATAYGWVRSQPSSWYHLNPCSMSSPELVQETDGRVDLSGGFSFLTNWTLTAATTPGSYTLRDYMGQSCLTDNGTGNPVTMKTCTPGNKSQEWRIP